MVQNEICLLVIVENEIRMLNSYGRPKIQNHSEDFRTIKRQTLFCQTRFTSYRSEVELLRSKQTLVSF